MKYYIINPNENKNDNHDYKIVKVKEADEANFLEDYGHQVLASGGSMMEALLHFEQSKHDQQ